MKPLTLLFLLILSYSITSYGQTYYIVRHAEKMTNDSASMMSSDPPLTEAGKERARALRDVLKNKDIHYIFTTNTIRAKATAEPLSKAKKVPIEFYGPKPDSAFIRQLQSLTSNVLVVGHSNTVDDIVNGLCGKPLLNDLPDAAYDNLFIVTNNKGKYELKQDKYGKHTPVRESKKRTSP